MTSREAPLYRKAPLKIGCLQYCPKFKDVEANTEKIRSMVARIPPKSLNILVLPEMFLTGYMFPTPQSIETYLEPERIGPSSLLCREIAKKLGCFVVGGYPEKVDGDQESSSNGVERLRSTESTEAGSSTTTTLTPAHLDTFPLSQAFPKTSIDCAKNPGYNSAVLVNPDGEVIGNYRKSFLFEVDKNWSRYGQGFQSYDLPQPIGKLVIGICMDLNPKDFVAPYDAYELANYVKTVGADILVMPMNWCLSLPPPGMVLTEEQKKEQEQERREWMEDDGPDESSLNYWASRLGPLHDPAPTFSEESTAPANTESVDGVVKDSTPTSGSDGKEVIVVCANRTGTEDGTTFVGTSCVMTVSSSPSRIELIECLGRRDEEVLVALVN